MTSQPQAFLSYTRVDDEFFGGAITGLRRLLELGVQVVTGDRSFQIFQDVDGIEFGEQWQKELDQAISAARFLIPILTPLFFRSDACRDELGKFVQHERSTGRNDLILPIYFVTTPLLEKDDLLKTDPLAVEISKRQRYDWRSQADLPINDPQLRRAVKDLSEKIDKALQRTQAVPPHEQMARRQHAQSEVETASRRLVDQIDLAKKKVSLRRILWVDDRPDNNTFERRAMEAYSIQFVLALSTAEALEKIAEQQFDVIISDMGRPPDARAGYTLLEALRSRGFNTPYFIYAGSRAPQHVAEAVRRGAQGSTNVPDELIALVLAALESDSRG
jgi:CheY-like chemotaxis protein